MSDKKEYTPLISCKIPDPSGTEAGELEVNKELMQSILDGAIKPTSADLWVTLEKAKLNKYGKPLDDGAGNVVIEKMDSHVISFNIQILVPNNLHQPKEEET